MKFLASKNFANSLILLILLYLIAATIWPQGKLFNSPVIILLGILFVVNLSACTIQQIMLKPKGRKIGLVIFHLGIIVLLGGVGVNILWGGQGSLDLGVGQETNLSSLNFRNWQEGIFLKQWESNDRIKLANVHLEMKENKVYLISGTVQYTNQNGEIEQKLVNFNQGLKIGNARLWVTERGFAPVFDWGNQLNHWGIATIRQGEKERYQDQQIRGDYKLKGEYFPSGADGRQGQLKLTIQGPNGKVNSFLLRPKDTFYVGLEKVVWAGTSNWLEFSVKIQPGLPFIWGGAILIVLGSAIYYLPLLWKREKHVI